MLKACGAACRVTGWGAEVWLLAVLDTINCFRISWFLALIWSMEACGGWGAWAWYWGGAWEGAGASLFFPREMELVRLASFLLAASTLLVSSCCCSLASCFTRILAASSSRDMEDVAELTERCDRLANCLPASCLSCFTFLAGGGWAGPSPSSPASRLATSSSRAVAMLDPLTLLLLSPDACSSPMTRPRTCRSSAVARKSSKSSSGRLASPWYMKSSSAATSPFLTPRR